MRVVLTQQARKDLLQARKYLADNSPTAADRLAEAITAALERLASGLVEGPEAVLRDGRTVRTWSVPPYKVYYRRTKDELVVVRIYHSARKPIERE